jgi:hypothetical protein
MSSNSKLNARTFGETFMNELIEKEISSAESSQNKIFLSLLHGLVIAYPFFMRWDLYFDSEGDTKFEFACRVFGTIMIALTSVILILRCKYEMKFFMDYIHLVTQFVSI